MFFFDLIVKLVNEIEYLIEMQYLITSCIDRIHGQYLCILETVIFITFTKIDANKY